MGDPRVGWITVLLRLPLFYTMRSEIWATVQTRPHRAWGEFERGGAPPLSVGPAGRAPRLPVFMQAREPSPRTKGSGGL
jgi:hypothetical protein